MTPSVVLNAAPPVPNSHLYIVMGIAACGKSHIGRLLCQTFTQSGCISDFMEGDDYHTDEAIEQMRHGIGLADTQRWPWLYRIREACAERLLELDTERQEDMEDKVGIADGPAPAAPVLPNAVPLVVILSCSALRLTYRDFLRTLQGSRMFAELRFIFLDCSAHVLYDRVRHRGHHFAGSSLLKSQLMSLEPPSVEQEPDVIPVNGDLADTQILPRLVTLLQPSLAV
ncbi:hypothetical protein IWQ60_011510 [Tieghemiomyces parasiticus]|uniref:gluconokinase n=1 Tax=Tieghemiomyces parasiticus TaxID=78921 RepID=A0A9W8DID7_9FUNG|nr:hypothetical protein IWQ60_011510 [Tieghemiomyces parasiticus]